MGGIEANSERLAITILLYISFVIINVRVQAYSNCLACYLLLRNLPVELAHSELNRPNFELSYLRRVDILLRPAVVWWGQSQKEHR